MNNIWEEIYSKKNENAMMQFPYPIIIELLNYYKNKYPKQNLKDINILEIGCGSGASIKYLANLGCNVYGVDISETAVNYAKKSFEKDNLNGNIQVASVDSIPFENDFFHIVIEHGVLVCVQEEIYRKAIDEIHRVMTGGGITLLTPASEISTKNIKLKANDNTLNDNYKGANIFTNSINLHTVINILNNRFNVVFLRRNDRVQYVISEDYRYIQEEQTNSQYNMFIEKI